MERSTFLFGPIVKKEGLIRNYRDILDNQWELLNRFYQACLNHGISSAHTDEEIDKVLEGI